MNSPKFCLSKKDYIPPGGFRVQCPVVETMIRASDFNELVSKCSNAIIASGNTPPPDLVAQIEHRMCEMMPGYRYCKPCMKNKKQTITFGAIIRWITAMYEFAKTHGFKLVEQTEAERRAKICAACPYQVEAAGCWGCRGVAGLLPWIAGARTTPYDTQLKACGVCACYNSVSVHLPKSLNGEDGLEFPEWCWKRND